MYEEEKQNIHKFMQEEAAYRALQEARSDPEIEAILVNNVFLTLVNVYQNSVIETIFLSLFQTHEANHLIKFPKKTRFSVSKFMIE